MLALEVLHPVHPTLTFRCRDAKTIRRLRALVVRAVPRPDIDVIGVLCLENFAGLCEAVLGAQGLV